ncbi:MAG: NRDE family protein [Flavobacteriales bacterium]|nr:NRDE family protein [Flavobacteriales bacterium]
MCTVTYIPTRNGFFLTSNRDESPTRITETPKPYELWNGLCHVVFPRDTQAGGSWIAMASNGQVACLLNGAFIKHERQLPYRKSRGLILLEYFENYSPLQFAEQVDLHQIEPFTLLMINQDEFCELRYDGSERHIRILDKAQPYIWSSATLYNLEESYQKEQHFMEWLHSEPSLNVHSIMKFHGLNNCKGFLLDRPQVKTVSITTVYQQLHIQDMHYADLQFGSINHFQLPLQREQTSIS